MRGPAGQVNIDDAFMIAAATGFFFGSQNLRQGQAPECHSTNSQKSTTRCFVTGARRATCITTKNLQHRFSRKGKYVNPSQPTHRQREDVNGVAIRLGGIERGLCT